MKSTVLGSSAAYAGAGEACSGYLLEHGSTKLLLDCGNGIASNLQRYMDHRDLTHVVISHMHIDHFIDLVPLHFAFWHTATEGIPTKPHIFLPPGGRRVLERVVSSIDKSGFFIEQVFHLEAYRPGKQYRLGDLVVEFTPTEHFVPTYAAAIYADGRKFTFSADTRPCAGLVRAAEGADLFLCEATIFDPSDAQGRQGHRTAFEAGEVARTAGVQRLLLTHFWPDCDRERSCAEASSAFTGSVEFAFASLSATL